MEETIKIKYHNKNLKKIEKIEKGDWIDLRASKIKFKNYNHPGNKSIDLEKLKYGQRIYKGSYGLISLDISMKLPNGYEATILPRSSTFKTWGIILTNSEGVIDNSYSGTNDIWQFPFCCLETFEALKFNDRVCQFRIQKKQPKIIFEEVDCLDSVNRGGFGSTGKN